MFKWSCLGLAVVFMGVLTWMAGNTAQGIRDLQKEIRDARQEIRDARPKATLEGEVDTKTDSAAIGVTMNYNPPFASPPRLTFDPTEPAGWRITDQKATSFSVWRGGSGVNTFRWKAEGHPAKSKLDEQNEAILQALQLLYRESLTQAAARRAENDAVVRELQGLRRELKQGVEGKDKK